MYAKLQNSKELLFQVLRYMSIRIHFCEDSNHSNQGYIRTGESEPQFMTEDWPLKNMRNILAFFI